MNSSELEYWITVNLPVSSEIDDWVADGQRDNKDEQIMHGTTVTKPMSIQAQLSPFLNLDWWSGVLKIEIDHGIGWLT